ncbi:MAG: DUF1540 domain-containing protein [Clostridiales bacterium]|nr:DUF1540 domain-containing protein [Clostridiales bacterium]
MIESMVNNMTELNCGVIHCSSNREGCCCRPEIKVTGHDAYESKETCCGSFEKIQPSASNAMDYSNTNPVSHVKCDVKTCIHYKDDECQATSITVQGAGACCKKDTECETFKRK